MTVEDLFRHKASRIIAIQQTATTAAAAKLLRAENIGAIVVKDSCQTEGDVVLGMLSERDIVAALVRYGADAISMPVARLMTRNVVSCRLKDDLDHVAGLMKHHHIRHVPVMDRESLVGVVSIRDLVAHWPGLAQQDVTADAT